MKRVKKSSLMMSQNRRRRRRRHTQPFTCLPTRPRRRSTRRTCSSARPMQSNTQPTRPRRFRADQKRKSLNPVCVCAHVFNLLGKSRFLVQSVTAVSSADDDWTEESLHQSMLKHSYRGVTQGIVNRATRPTVEARTSHGDDWLETKQEKEQWFQGAVESVAQVQVRCCRPLLRTQRASTHGLIQAHACCP